MKKLYLCIVLTIIFAGVEVAGSYYAGSIALASDAAHLVTDVLGLVASIWAISIATKDATNKYSFGYHRAEVMGTCISLFVIWGMTAYLLDAAIQRLISHKAHPVVGEIMFIIACCSIVFNIILIYILHSGDLESLQGDHGHSHGGHGHSHGDEEKGSLKK